MNPATTSSHPPTGADAAPDPTITALPTLSAEEVLREQLARANAKIAEQIQRIGEWSLSHEKLEAHRDHLAEQLAALEKNPFLFAVSNLDSGAAMMECGEKLHALAEIVQRRDGAGTLVLKLKVKPFKGSALIFTHEVKVTEPKPEPIQGIFYADDQGFSRNDPRQAEFAGFSRPDRSSLADPIAVGNAREEAALAAERRNGLR